MFYLINLKFLCYTQKPDTSTQYDLELHNHSNLPWSQHWQRPCCCLNTWGSSSSWQKLTPLPLLLTLLIDGPIKWGWGGGGPLSLITSNWAPTQVAAGLCGLGSNSQTLSKLVPRFLLALFTELSRPGGANPSDISPEESECWLWLIKNERHYPQLMCVQCVNCASSREHHHEV